MTPWSRRSFLASAGTLATAGGAGAAAGADGETREVPLLHTYIAGAERSVVREVARRLAPGAPLRLMREPENDYDTRAVAVWTQDGRKLGYVPRIDNQALANLMDAGLAPRASVAQIRTVTTRPDIRIDVRLSVG